MCAPVVPTTVASGHFEIVTKWPMCLTLAALQAANLRFRRSQTPSLGPIPRPARRMRASTRSVPREIYRPSRISPRPCYLCLRSTLSLPLRTAPKHAMNAPSLPRRAGRPVRLSPRQNRNPPRPSPQRQQRRAYQGDHGNRDIAQHGGGPAPATGEEESWPQGRGTNITAATDPAPRDFPCDRRPGAAGYGVSYHGCHQAPKWSERGLTMTLLRSRPEYSSQLSPEPWRWCLAHCCWSRRPTPRTVPPYAPTVLLSRTRPTIPAWGPTAMCCWLPRRPCAATCRSTGASGCPSTAGGACRLQEAA